MNKAIIRSQGWSTGRRTFARAQATGRVLARPQERAPGLCGLGGLCSRRKVWSPDAGLPGLAADTMALIITLLILGAILLFLETLLPGMIAGIIGFICLMAAVILGYRDFGFQTGNLILAVVLVGLVIGVLIWLKFFPESRIARRFISQGSVGELGVDKPELLNGTGVALTQLRPSGVANINGQRVDVVTEGGLIERGAAVKVVAVEGSRIVVREVLAQRKG